jgi:hypothetical protein
MKLRNIKGKKYTDDQQQEPNSPSDNVDNDDNDGVMTWQPNMEGFLKYLVDNKLVFDTVERIVDESSHVACE